VPDSALSRALGQTSEPPFLTGSAARVLSDATKSAPVWSPRTPRWTLECLRSCALVPVQGGVYQLNQVVEDEQRNPVMIHRGAFKVPSKYLSASHSQEDGMPVEFSAPVYNATPRQIPLQAVQSIVRVPNRVPALFSDNVDQLQTQLAIASEYICETCEELVFNHSDFGLVNNVSQRMQFRVNGPPAPDVLDDLLALGWRRPDMFAMHPEALAAFRKQANALNLPLEEVEVLGASFTSWRGLPIIPTNKLHLVAKPNASAATKLQGERVPGETTTNVLLMRLGAAKQGVVCLCAKGQEATSQLPYISVDFMGLGENALAGYLMTSYVAMAVLSSGALVSAEVSI
jgi:hypothetical protein